MDRGLIGKWRRLIGAAVEPKPDLQTQGFWDGAGKSDAFDDKVAEGVSLSFGDPRIPTTEVALWRALAHHPQQGDPSKHVDSAAVGPFVPERRDEGIEVWHRAELAALHALSWYGARDRVWAQRCDSAAAWMLDEVQPDNATNRPWAIHWFVSMAARGVRAVEAEMYAQTLLHNVLVAGEPPDATDTWLLLDAARWLDSM